MVESLVAARWKSALNSYIVIAANTGYLEGKVSFAIKTETNIKVAKFIEAVAPKEAEKPFWLAHKNSAAGILTVAQWKQMLRSMHFKDVDDLVVEAHGHSKST
jgi:hypothetical protein